MYKRGRFFGDYVTKIYNYLTFFPPPPPHHNALETEAVGLHFLYYLKKLWEKGIEGNQRPGIIWHQVDIYREMCHVPSNLTRWLCK
jgi:hypothetical protein